MARSPAVRRREVCRSPIGDAKPHGKQDRFVSTPPLTAASPPFRKSEAVTKQLGSYKFYLNLGLSSGSIKYLEFLNSHRTRDPSQARCHFALVASGQPFRVWAGDCHPSRALSQNPSFFGFKIEVRNSPTQLLRFVRPSYIVVESICKKTRSAARGDHNPQGPGTANVFVFASSTNPLHLATL